MNEIQKLILESLNNGISWYKKTMPSYSEDRVRIQGLITGLEMAHKLVSETNFEIEES